MKKWLMVVIAAIFVLTACGNKEEKNTQKADNSDEGTVGFEVLGDEIKQAPNIPADVEEEIYAAFNEYITAFNEKDITRYMNTLSKNPKGFSYEDEIKFTEDTFTQYDINRVASDVTIVSYTEHEAQVFSNLEMITKEIATDAELASSGRQVTVLVKEDGGWKVTRVAYIGNDPQQ